MLRITIIEILSFLLPFALFLIWRWQSDHDSVSRPTPVLKLAAAGAAMGVVVLIGLVVFDSMRAGHEGEQYVPPRLVDGEIIPGHFIATDETDAADEDETGEDEDPPQ